MTCAEAIDLGTKLFVALEVVGIATMIFLIGMLYGRMGYKKRDRELDGS